MQKLVKMRQDNVERDRDLNRLRNELSGLQNENVDMSDRIRQLNDLVSPTICQYSPLNVVK